MPCGPEHVVPPEEIRQALAEAVDYVRPSPAERVLAREARDDEMNFNIRSLSMTALERMQRRVDAEMKRRKSNALSRHHPVQRCGCGLLAHHVGTCNPSAPL